MPRDLSGNYTLPAGNPVSSGGVISSVWANSTLSDLANEMGNSLAKDGRTPITGPFKFVSGTSALPGITFSTDPGTGLWLPATGILAFSTGAFERMRIDTTGKVGIGTSSPAFGLDVNASVIALGTKTASSTNGGYVRYRDDTGAVRWAAGVLWPAGETSFSIYDAIAGSSRLVIDSAGRVGIGGTPTLRALEITQNGNAYNGMAVNNTDAGASARAAVVLGNGSTYTAIGTYGTGAGNYGFIESPQLSIVTSGTERVRVATTGRLQHFANNESYNIQLNSTSVSNGPWLGSGAADVFTISTAGGTERFRIDAAGKVGIGIVPVYPLDVLGASSIIARFQSTGNPTALIQSYSGSVEFTSDALTTIYGSANASGVVLIYVGGATRFVIDSVGRVTMPNQPSFCATGVNGAMMAGIYVICGTVVNQKGGSNYNSSTGVFTAPVAGYYSFSGNINAYNMYGSTAPIYARIQVNAAVVASVFIGNIANAAQYSGAVHLNSWYLNAGDTVTLGTYSAQQQLAPYTTFSGSLIS